MIYAVYHSEPPAFPATDQHPEAQRYQVGRYWVDAIGEPTLAEVEAMLAPPPAPSRTFADINPDTISLPEIAELLKRLG